jgi:hypothetical protein
MLKAKTEKVHYPKAHRDNVIKLPIKPKLLKPANAPKIAPKTKANDALHPIIVAEEVFCSRELRKYAFYADDSALILNMDVNAALDILKAHKMIVNCVVTSPPFYGQRDYQVEGQIGLEGVNAGGALHARNEQHRRDSTCGGAQAPGRSHPGSLESSG